MSKFLSFLVACLIMLIPCKSEAQVPVRQAQIFLNSNTQIDGCGTGQEIWQIMTGTCEAPATTPWIQTLRVRVGTTVVNIPRANVTRLTTAAECTPTAAPCLRTAPVTLPAGQVTLAFVTNAGEEGAPSAAIPFSPTTVLPSAPATPRLVVLP
jgi:hypothetical protein